MSKTKDALIAALEEGLDTPFVNDFSLENVMHEITGRCVPKKGDVVSYVTLDDEGDVIDVSTMRVVHVAYGYGRSDWFKAYGTHVHTGEFVSVWDDQLIDGSLLSDGTKIEECT